MVLVSSLVMLLFLGLCFLPSSSRWWLREMCPVFFLLHFLGSFNFQPTLDWLLSYGGLSEEGGRGCSSVLLLCSAVCFMIVLRCTAGGAVVSDTGTTGTHAKRTSAAKLDSDGVQCPLFVGNDLPRHVRGV